MAFHGINDVPRVWNQSCDGRNQIYHMDGQWLTMHLGPMSIHRFRIVVRMDHYVVTMCIGRAMLDSIGGDQCTISLPGGRHILDMP